MQAIRKAPQHTAVGFKQTVQKLLVTVELLMGDIPERHIFRQSTMRHALAPYFQMTQAVRLGDINRFNQVLENYGKTFQVTYLYVTTVDGIYNYNYFISLGRSYLHSHNPSPS